VSEQILNSTSAQYCAIHVGIRWKIWTEDKSKTDTTKTKDNPEKANNTKHSKTKLQPSSVAFYDTRPGNEVGLFYNAPARAHTESGAQSICIPDYIRTGYIYTVRPDRQIYLSEQ